VETIGEDAEGTFTFLKINTATLYWKTRRIYGKQKLPYITNCNLSLLYVASEPYRVRLVSRHYYRRINYWYKLLVSWLDYLPPIRAPFGQHQKERGLWGRESIPAPEIIFVQRMLRGGGEIAFGRWRSMYFCDVCPVHHIWISYFVICMIYELSSARV